ncbi:putative acyl-coA-binding protein [Halteromyces radiatus]|uniref:putative acyl-coA-binding protein n=1 Tax=Halteromyces radiatus TaxID=101107 RepID=UPI00221FC194|nr:putative acyl-coA-binding protein [Halteromyces radiatus]KAI8099960.1 putative acyl-coA-binding protein [Halteromyces radiatus]
MPSAAFETAAKEAKGFTKLPDDEILLRLYGLYKQATFGDNTTDKPLLDLKGRYKWEAWKEHEGVPQVEAEVQYIALVEELKSSYQ